MSIEGGQLLDPRLGQRHLTVRHIELRAQALLIASARNAQRPLRLNDLLRL
jgi:hypothetical protein